MGSFKHTLTFVDNNKLYTIQVTLTEPLEETCSTGLVLLHALCDTQNLTISILIDGDRNQNGDILKLSALRI
ncbi:hypothetical protein [Butyricicoccus faecihominis]|uniref:hypothetical protein n=1 Tax=Butyricicoccus faecihominis TaxID=1712515 RepID=UPI003AF34AF3